MKRILLFCLFALQCVVFTNAQGLEGIVVERYYISDAADEAVAIAQGAISPLPVGSVAYRVYVDMAPGYKFSQLFGNNEHPMTVNTTTSFYNDSNFGVALNPGAVSQNNTRRFTTMIDSWFTTGGTCAGRVGVMEAEDTDGTIGNQQNILANNPGGCYNLPINGTNARDGMIPTVTGTYVIPNVLGLGTALDVLDQTDGNSIFINNGAIAALGGVVGPTAANRVLVAQFTTIGTLEFALNVQLVNIATNEAENYVASNPGNNELTHPTLTFISGLAPTVSIVSPALNQTIPANQNFLIQASGTDNGGIVTAVDFYIDGVLLGTDLTAPFSFDYFTTPGPHSVYAIATDNDCQTNTSPTINFNVISNIPPIVTVIAPSTAVEGEDVTITANASDPDGSIAQVEFFVNDISIGIDNMAPYNASFVAQLGIGQEIYAVATDNLGASTESTILFLNVNENLLPIVEVTNPAFGAVYIAPEEIVFTANASDEDGVVERVDFYLNNDLIGSDESAPYEFIWQSVPGEFTIQAVAIDNLNGQGFSDEILFFVADPNALPYFVGNLDVSCEQETFCVPIGVSLGNTVNDVIGYDMIVEYNVENIVPTGVFTVSDDLTNPDFVDVVFNDLAPGQLGVSIFFNGAGNGMQEFNGTGEIICIEFVREIGFEANETTTISVSSLVESYISGTQEQAVQAGEIHSNPIDVLSTQLLFMQTGLSIAFDETNPSDYLITEVIPYNESLEANLDEITYPNLNGEVTLNLENGTTIEINRQVAGDVSVQPIVNGYDVALVKSLLNGIGNEPSVYSVLAMDVNLDGVVSAGDVSQILQRATLAIPEYMQAWNYSNEGVSNGEPSKDWIFISENDALSNPSFGVSSNFPSDDGVGYSANRLPLVTFLLDLPVTNYSLDGTTCAIITPDNYRGIMLGDVDGSYANYEADGELRGGVQVFDNDTVTIDLNAITYESLNDQTFIHIPVYISNTEQAASGLDLWFEFNTSKLQYNGIINEQDGLEVFGHFNTTDEVIRISSATNNTDELIITNVPAYYLSFLVLDQCSGLVLSDFFNEFALINGNTVEVNYTALPSFPEIVVSSSSEVICPGDEIDFSFVSNFNGQTVTSYNWTFDNGLSSSEETASTVYEQGGQYNVQVQLFTSAFCAYNINTAIEVSPAPTVSFTGIVINGNELIVEFTNSSSISSGTIVSYEWNFGDGNTSIEESPTHDYAGESLYEVTLSATSDLGCVSSTTQTIDVVNSIEENTLNEFVLYPNPSKGQVWFNVKGMGTVKVIDAIGNIVYTKEKLNQENSMELNLSALASGTYSVTFESDGKFWVQQLVLMP